MRKPDFHFPTLIGVLVAAVGLVAGVVLLRNPLTNLVGASPEETPKQAKITNISDQEFVVTWITDKAVAGFIQYGENDPDLVVSDDRDQNSGSVGSYFTHFVTVKNLKASTNYKFRIGSGKTLYDQQGKLYEVSTGPTLNDPPVADVAYGQVTTGSGDPAGGSIIYAHLPGMVPQAALVKSSGSWVIPLATSRTTDLTSFAPYDKDTDKLELFAQGGPMGSAQLIVTTANDKPVANIVLGGTGEAVTTANITPAPTIDPNIASKFSGSVLAPATEATGAAALTILTPKYAEAVNTSQPEIIGKAPANSTVSIEIHSDQVVTGSVIADKSGNWSYTVPAGLSPGEHTITISTIVNGVVKKVTRSFVVQAAGESNTPAFSATASGTLATPTPTKKPVVTTTPTIVPSITLTVTPTRVITPTPTKMVQISYPSTESGVPQSGNLTPTFILAILGIGLIGAGLFSMKFKFI